MMGFEEPLVLLIALLLLYLWWRLGRGPKEVWPIRILIVLLGILIAASPRFFLHEASRRIVLLADKSLSCGRDSVAAAEEWNRLIRERLDPKDRLFRIVFGSRASTLAQEGRISELAGSEFDDASDLSAGLALSGAVLQGRKGGRVLLITDGLYTGPDPMEHAPALIKSGVSVDFAPILEEEALDYAVTEVLLPERVQQGHPFEITFFIHAPAKASAGLHIQRGEETLKREVTLEAGENRITFTDSNSSSSRL